jgi:hypothetical protein
MSENIDAGLDIDVQQGSVGAESRDHGVRVERNVLRVSVRTILHWGDGSAEEEDMHRTIVQVMQVRMADVLPGDVVNKNHADPRGWILVKGLQELPHNAIAILAESDRDSINGSIYDIVGVQLTKVVEVPMQAPQAA